MSFKARYESDPEFRRKHLAYISEYVPCECGINVRRSNMTKHVKTKKHSKLLQNKKTKTDEDIIKMMADIDAKLNLLLNNQ
jgi:hypothetical protein